jgi:predicted permease
MKALRRAWNRLIGTVAGRRRERDAADEFECHIDMLTEENLRRGMSPDEARRAARLTFGNIEVTRESYHDQRGLPTLDSFQRDIRYAFRGMRRNPVFTAIAIACLALGIGANTAIFSLVNAVMLRQVGAAHPEQLVHFQYTRPPNGAQWSTSGYGPQSFPYTAYEAMRDSAKTLDGVAAYAPLGYGKDGVTIKAGGQLLTAAGEMVTSSYFSILGISPVAGRLIAANDLAAASPNVVVISQRLWQRELGGDRSVIGRSISLNGTPSTIIGVAPASFAGLTPGIGPDVWVPLRPVADFKPWGQKSAASAEAYRDRRYWWCMIVGRRKPGSTPAQVQTEAEFLFRQSFSAESKQLQERLPQLLVSQISPGFWMMRRGYASMLQVLMVLAALVLLIACTNVAMLLLARAKARQKELGIRLAIGAGHARLIRQLLTESVLLSLCGGVLGLLFAKWGGPALLRLLPGSQNFLIDLHPDTTVLAFALIVSLTTGILFGLAPAFRASRVDPARQMTETAAPNAPHHVMGKVLVATQVGLSVVLLFGAGLFLRTFRNLSGQELGLQRDNLLLFEIDPDRSGYKDERGFELYRRLTQRVEALPGVRSVSLVWVPLLSRSHSSSYFSLEAGVSPDRGRSNEAYFNFVGPRFFETMGIRVLLGEGITLRDTESKRATAVVNKAWAREYFPTGNPIGQRVSLGQTFDPLESYEIVGVAEDAKYDELRDDVPRTIYFSYTAPQARLWPMSFVVRTAGEPLVMGDSVRGAVREVNPNLPLFNMRTQNAQIDESLGVERMLAHGSTLFGALALLLVAVGIYGTLSYVATQRTGEIGIRMALGASRASVVWMILRGALVTVAWGLAAGLPVALILARLASSTFYGVKPYDALTIVATVLILWSVAAVSGFVPASRASRIAPMHALRHE